MSVFCIEYDKLYYIPNFETRIDTAKENFKNLYLAGCSCNICCDTVNLILSLKFYENE